MQTIKCSCCSANVKLPENSNTTVCPYCGSSIILNENEKVVAEQKSKEVNINIHNAGSIPPRPKVKVWLAILLFIMEIWPGIIYLCIIDSKQRKWDEQYKNN